jgi:threonine/homoserine/homoserine lactone efflux protein
MFLEWSHIFVGLGIGLIMSAPAGPVNFLCFHRTLHHGLLSGLMVGFGAVLADGLFSSIAIFGLKFGSQRIEENIGLMQVVGGLLIIGFGIYLLFHKQPELRPPREKQRIWQGLISGGVLTLSNPGNFLGFIAMFSGITDVIAGEHSLFRGASLVLGVVLGALLWWILFTGLIGYFRSKVTQGALIRINKIAGALILLSGFLLIGRYIIDYIPRFTGG